MAAYAARWQLELGPILPGGRLSACVAGRDRDGRAVVLKVPTVAAAGRLELRALRHWQGAGVVSVLHGDARAGIFLMERLTPGTPGAGDAAAAGRLLRRLHRAPGNGAFPPLQHRLQERLARSAQRCALPGNVDGRRLHDRAAGWIDGGSLPTGPRVVLHGDFQPKNLLEGGDGVRAIDPLVCIGHPAYDAATWCVLGGGEAPIAGRVDAVARALGTDAEPIARFAALMCALEYRPYRPEAAARLLAYAG